VDGSAWRSADEFGWPDGGDIEGQIKRLGGDPEKIARYLLLWRAIWTDKPLSQVVPTGFWHHGRPR